MATTNTEAIKPRGFSGMSTKPIRVLDPRRPVVQCGPLDAIGQDLQGLATICDAHGNPLAATIARDVGSMLRELLAAEDRTAAAQKFRAHVAYLGQRARLGK